MRTLIGLRKRKPTFTVSFVILANGRFRVYNDYLRVDRSVVSFKTRNTECNQLIKEKIVLRILEINIGDIVQKRTE